MCVCSNILNRRFIQPCICVGSGDISQQYALYALRNRLHVAGSDVQYAVCCNDVMHMYKTRVEYGISANHSKEIFLHYGLEHQQNMLYHLDIQFYI